MSTPTCSECGGKTFTIVVEQLITVKFFDNEDEDHEVTDGPRGDMEWTDESDLICEDCGHCASLKEMCK